MALQRIADVDEIAPGSAGAFEVDGRRIAVVHVAADEFYAIDDTCSHAEASLAEGRVEGYQIECPHHGARFDVRDGRFLTLPAVAPVRSHPVIVKEGGIYIDVDA